MQANGQQQPLLGQLPTTIEMALLPSTESRVITEPEEPDAVRKRAIAGH